MAYGGILGQKTPVTDNIASGNMNAVTSNAVYQAIAAIPEGVQIETGSYVGTGTYGASNPNSLTFGFEPKLVIILSVDSGSDSQTTTDFEGPIFIKGKPYSDNGNSVQFSGTTVSWHYYGYATGTTAASNQRNAVGSVYYYLTIG